MYNFKSSGLLLVAWWLGLQGLLAFPGVGATPAKPASCPADIETLTALLIRDLPSYANRVIQRSRRLSRTTLSRTTNNFYVILAGRPEFEPLPLTPGQYTSVTPAADGDAPRQVFLTTLERQYGGGKAVQSQLYHWLFLTQTPSGWRLALMFTRFGSSARERPPTPPQESSNGIVGQAVTNWLRDCRAGAIRQGRRGT